MKVLVKALHKHTFIILSIYSGGQLVESKDCANMSILAFENTLFYLILRRDLNFLGLLVVFLFQHRVVCGLRREWPINLVLLYWY